MKPGFKFFSVAALLSCSLCGISAINSYKSETVSRTIGVFGVLSVLGTGTNFADAFPPIIQKRLGSPTPQIGGSKFSVSFEDEDSDEEEDDLLESSPRVEPRITPSNRDQCLAKLLCGMSVPVTGGGSKKNYYSEYAQIVSKFFEAFPLDDDYQSKESMEVYDDYSNEDDKPKRVNSKRKPLNSSRVEATAPTLQLFDLASVDVGPKKEDLLGKNRTRKEDIDKVHTGNRIARARRIVENIGQKLQTVRQCQSISGCPFTFKQLREKLKKSEAKRVASNVPLPGPIWPANPNRNRDPTPSPFQMKPKPKPQNRPIPPTSKPEPLSVEGLFSNEEPIFPFKDSNKGDDELEEIFGPPKVHKRPGSGFHQGVDDNYHYEYNPDKPWRPGGSNNGGNSYGYRPWKTRPNNNQNQWPNSRPRPQSGQNNHNQRPHSGQNNQNHRPQQDQQQRERPAAPARPGLRPAQKKTPPGNKPPKNRPYSGQLPLNQRPAAPAKVSQAPPPPPKTTAAPATTRSPFPKKKISYSNTQYQSPTATGDDDEDAEDINKVAPVELVGNSDAGEPEVKSTTTSAPKTTEASKNNDDSDEYDDDDGDYYEGGDYDDDDDDDEDDAQDDEKEDDDEYSDEDEESKKEKAKEKTVEEKKKKRKENRIKKKAQKLQADQKVKETVAKVEASKKKASSDPFFDDESDDVKEIWSKLNLGATGANYKPDKKKKEKESAVAEVTTEGKKTEKVANDAEEESDEEDEEEDDEEEGRKGSLITLSQKNRASSTSTSASDEDDDEVEDEKESKGKRKTKGKPKKEEKGDKSELNDDVDLKTKSKGSKKSKKKGSTKKDEDSEEKEARAKWKQVMMEIGGRPLVPKPENDMKNAKKTSGLVSNHFKLQFINPYGSGGHQPEPLDNLDGNSHRPYQPMSATPPPGASGFASALPFKINMNMNAGPLGAFTGGISTGPEGHGHNHHGMDLHHRWPPQEGGGHHGHMGPPPPGTRGSMEFSGPPSNINHNHQQGGPPSPYSHSYLQSGPTGGSTGGGGLSGSSLFKLNPLPALSKLFKRPSSSQNSFDPMQQGGSGPQGHNHNAPAGMNAFVHRPIGPESSSYRRGAITPASGSSSKKESKKGSKSKAKKKTKF
ncbi:hypothetical protein Ocin01_14291 [Orchesella cincta]|uniref:Uncharacterized protein n=1 Tax=Orchesella cincta TaxID=48709 RepID=A0A1D2MHJ2_ORCCI|nr:hypothetical protein Ocin01_14291 [Orchesella cincta]